MDSLTAELVRILYQNILVRGSMFIENMIIVRSEKYFESIEDWKNKNRLETKKYKGNIDKSLKTKQVDWKQSFVIGNNGSNIVYNNG